MDAESKWNALEELSSSFSDCTMCGLCDPKGRERRNVVFGSGDPNASILIVGEAPGEREDEIGDPFVGQAGVLLDKYLKSFCADRDDVFLCNVVCCRPTEEHDPRKNRKPSKAEILACRERLDRTIEIVDPYIVVLLGSVAMKTLTKTTRGITTIAKTKDPTRLTCTTEGMFGEVKRPAIATFHPSYLLRNDSMAEGSDLHMTYLAFQRAFRLADSFKKIYEGIEIPYRGEDDE